MKKLPKSNLGVWVQKVMNVEAYMIAWQVQWGSLAWSGVNKYTFFGLEHLLCKIAWPTDIVAVTSKVHTTP